MNYTMPDTGGWSHESDSNQVSACSKTLRGILWDVLNAWKSGPERASNKNYKVMKVIE